MSGATWDPFRPIAASEHGAAQAAERDEMKRLARATFQAPAGAAFLARLRAEVMDQPSYHPGEPFDLVAWREGQKALLRRIEALLKED